MKREGKEGFTFDPPSTEWDYWEASDKAHASKLARGPNGRFVKRSVGNVVKDCVVAPVSPDQMAYFARHSPTQQQNAPEPAHRPRLSYGLLIAFAVMLIVGALIVGVVYG